MRDLGYFVLVMTVGMLLVWIALMFLKRLFLELRWRLFGIRGAIFDDRLVTSVTARCGDRFLRANEHAFALQGETLGVKERKEMKDDVFNYTRWVIEEYIKLWPMKNSVLYQDGLGEYGHWSSFGHYLKALPDDEAFADICHSCAVEYETNISRRGPDSPSITDELEAFGPLLIRRCIGDALRMEALEKYKQSQLVQHEPVTA